ncbi:MAG: thiamine diphosphokinase [Brevefilum sp.]|nr:thiamine diphosphokinase [Brevefilum sp.]MDT8382459.1 thiamine diphosphokinase [Brevefilum sp.]MDW7755196.1 thiamine diphosphokinase [Brevefilum sp.]
MSPKYQKIVLFANGELPEPKAIAQKLGDADFLIAVDGGLNHMIPLNLEPDLIIGDLDSIDEATLQPYREKKTKIQKFPTDKDQNDLELAIQAALEMNPKTIWIVAALGNRIDQTLANIFLLTRDELRCIDTHLVDGKRDVFLIREQALLSGEPGQLISLVPINGSAEGITTKGLKYPLNNETLYPDQTRGISNRLTGTDATITVEKGSLLCIHETTTKNEKRG